MQWLVQDWQNFTKWWSVRFGALVVLAPILYTQVAQLQQYLPQSTFNYAMSGLGILVILGRLKNQQ